jgi:IS30 family transposase
MAHLTLEQRYEIYTFLKVGLSKSEIATKIGKDKCIIYCEIKRNTDERNHD